MNTIAKGAIAYFVGSRDLRRTIVRAFGVIVFVGVFSSVVMLLFDPSWQRENMFPSQERKRSEGMLFTF